MVQENFGLAGNDSAYENLILFELAKQNPKHFYFHHYISTVIPSVFLQK